MASMHIYTLQERLICKVRWVKAHNERKEMTVNKEQSYSAKDFF
jgi:hypothetical protein